MGTVQLHQMKDNMYSARIKKELAVTKSWHMKEKAAFSDDDRKVWDTTSGGRKYRID